MMDDAMTTIAFMFEAGEEYELAIYTTRGVTVSSHEMIWYKQSVHLGYVVFRGTCATSTVAAIAVNGARRGDAWSVKKLVGVGRGIF